MENLNIWGDFVGKRLLFLAMALSLLTHGVIVYFTLPGTYDAYVHMFFADHYARFWFEPWEYRWYTGFLTTSYPPLVHQLVALLSFLFPLKVAFTIFANIILQILIIGVYRFTKLFFNKVTAGIAAILLVVHSSLVETLHVYGQMPTLTGLAFLLNALPFLYLYLVRRSLIYLVMGMCLLAVTISSHHVTAIFGMVFFIAPTLFMAAADGPCLPYTRQKLPQFLWKVVLAAWERKKELILFGILMAILGVGLIYPYWYWSKSDPIAQVSIPHGSRDNFFKNTSSGLVFFIIPLLLVLAVLPAISYSITRKKRFIGWAVSFFLCLLLGSGGTTPLPKLMLGSNAFNILTLDRFGFWASIMALPFMAYFLHSLIAGSVKATVVQAVGNRGHFLITSASGFVYFLFLIYIFHLGSFRPLQPKQVDIQPIVNFLNRDEHMRWRYLTLGFGDQMAWLGANTLAASVDGNYHSARRLPELTTRPIERLENAKFSGEAGLSSLNDFLVNAEKYSLKYVFSNDRYYDPLLYYNGWTRTILLENGIMVWEKGNISTIKPIVPKKLNPYMKYAWGILPVGALVVSIVLVFFYLTFFKEVQYQEEVAASLNKYPKWIGLASTISPLVFFGLMILFQLNEQLFLNQQKDPQTTVLNYFSHLDFQRFESAFKLFKPLPTYTLDQYLLEKSVNEGGLLPSYAKLDSLHLKTLAQSTDKATILVHSFWKTAMGKLPQIDSLQLSKLHNKWYIVPQSTVPEIPPYQMRSYNFTLFKKQGKREISTFPTVKDDRVKKAFAAFEKVNLIAHEGELYLTGKFLNADDIPINIALKAVITTQNGESFNFFPAKEIHHNIWPKASTFFKINLNKSPALKLNEVKAIVIYAETDVTENGYLHGGTLAYTHTSQNPSTEAVAVQMYNELSVDINIPGILLAQLHDSGAIADVKLLTHTKALRSGLHVTFNKLVGKITDTYKVVDKVPIELFINGTERSLVNTGASVPQEAYQALPHCFISQPIYLQ